MTNRNAPPSPITQVSTTDIAQLLAPSPPGRRMPMRGFDEEFVDIADYIIRITDRIWHERKIDLCRRYYSDDCAIHTLAGDIVGAAIVEANTHATLEAFPDRTLDGDNVIWSGNENDGYYSSHLITSRMTNLGASEFGPATNKRARIRTIADCLCKENKIIEEWLVRDNGALVQQLGLNIQEVAQNQARNDLKSGTNLNDFLKPWREETITKAQTSASIALPEYPENAPQEFAAFFFGDIIGNNNLSALPSFFDFRVHAHMPTEHSLYGVLEYQEYLKSFFNAVPDGVASVDHVASIPYLGDAIDVAIRWSFAGTHMGDGMFGEASGAPIYILGATHWRIINGRVREEWTVFDALAVIRQIETHRLSA